MAGKPSTKMQDISTCVSDKGQVPQRVHVGKWYILRAQWGSHIPTLRPKYIPYSFMDPLGTLGLST